MNGPGPSGGERSPLSAMRRQIESTPLPGISRRRGQLVARLQARPRLALGGAAASLATAAALAFALGAFTHATPAYAVADNADGTVTITLHDLSAMDALNARLAADGIAVRAVPIQAGCTATAHVVSDRYAEPAQTPGGGPPAVLDATIDPNGGQVTSVTVHPPTKPGLTLVVAAATDARLLGGDVVQGAVPACVSWPMQWRP